MAKYKETGALIKFTDLDPYGHSILPTFYWKISINFQGNNVYDPQVVRNLGGAGSPLAIRCTSTELPVAQHDLIMVDAKRFMFPEQGIIRRNGQITLTAYESNDAILINTFNNAYNNLFSHETGEMNNNSGSASNHHYKFDVQLDLYRNYNEYKDNKAVSFYIQRALFLMLDNGGMATTGSSPDYFRPSLTITYGNFYIEQEGKSDFSDIFKSTAPVSHQ